MRRLTLAMLVAALLPASAWATRHPHAEKLQLTKAGKKLAQQAVLRRSDIGPDWTAIALPSGNSNLSCPNFDPDLSGFTINGKASSSFVQSGLAQVSSSTEVYASQAQAAGDFRAGARPELAQCLRYAIQNEFSKSASGTKATVLSSRMVRAPRVGERSAAYRVILELQANKLVFKAYSDFLVIQRGRTIAALGFTGIDTPVPSQTFYGRIVAGRMR